MHSSNTSFCKGDIVQVNQSMIESVIASVQMSSEVGCGRICLHDTPNNPLHEMLIIRRREYYSRPDKHTTTSESHLILRGKEAVVFFSDDGEIINSIILEQNGVIAYRVNTDIYHMIIPLTDIAVDVEVKLGPFNQKSNIFPDWAPDGSIKTDVERFMYEVKSAINLA